MTSISARPVPLAAMERHMERVQAAIEGGNIIRPQEMYDPGLVHPYADQPPAGKAVLGDLETVHAALKRHPSATTCPEIAASLQTEAGGSRRTGHLYAAAAVTLAVGAVAGGLLAPGLGAWLGSGAGFLASAGLGVAAARSYAEAGRTERAAGLVQGWERNIQDPHGLFPIPVEDSVPFEYVSYVEGILIGQRRRAAFP